MNNNRPTMCQAKRCRKVAGNELTPHKQESQ